MLRNRDAAATIAVKNMDVAKKFYEGTLGLMAVDTGTQGAFMYKSGGSKVLVYESKYAGTNKATAATWAVDDVEGAVRALKANGVAFERYDMPGTTREGDVHVAGGIKAAWFKDPDGNILAIVNA